MMTDTYLPTNLRAVHHHPVSRRNWLRLAGQNIDKALTALLDYRERSRQRRQLLGLSEDALKDFAANRADAEGEASKPFWRS